MSSDLESINTELAEIIDRLNALPSDAFAERYAMLKHQDELREAAAAYRDDLNAIRPTEEVEAELASLRRWRDQLIETRIGFVTSMGGSNQGPTPGAWVELRDKAMGAAGLDRINARISQLEDILERPAQTP